MSNLNPFLKKKLPYIIQARDERGILLRVSITVIPLNFLVSIPVSKKGLTFSKSWSQSRKKDKSFKVLITVSKMNHSSKNVTISYYCKPRFYHKFLSWKSWSHSWFQWPPHMFESQSQSRKKDWHCESLYSSLKKGIGFSKVSIPVSKMGLGFWKSLSCLDCQNSVSLITVLLGHLLIL